MKKMKFLTATAAIALCAVLMLSGCSKSSTASQTDGNSSEADTSLALNTEDMFTDRDFETGFDESTAEKITVSDSNSNITQCSSDIIMA